MRNHLIFTKLLNSKNALLTHKIKSNDMFIQLNEYPINIKSSLEIKDINKNDLSKLNNLTDNDKHLIGYRYKQRLSLIIEDNADYTIQIDLTDVKSSKNLSNIYIIDSIYELELEVVFKKKATKQVLDMLCNKFGNEIIRLEKFLQESDMLITKTEINNKEKIE